MKSTIKGLIVALMLTTSSLLASADIQIYTTDNSNGKITAKTIEKAFADAGFFISGNNNMNNAFKAKFQKTHHKMYHLFTLYKADIVLELVKVSPNAGLFAPLSMSFYMDKGSNNISISSLSLAGMAKITGISSDNKHMQEYAKLIKDTIAKALPNGSFEEVKYKALKPEDSLVTTFSFEMEDVTTEEEVEEELEGMQQELEGSLASVGFVMAGFNNLGEEFTEFKYEKYNFFDAYSMCKLAVIFTVAEKNPEAGAFAPCTLFMYKEKSSNMMHISFPSVRNWISSLAITDEVSKKVLLDAQEVMVGVINETFE